MQKEGKLDVLVAIVQYNVEGDAQQRPEKGPAGGNSNSSDGQASVDAGNRCITAAAELIRAAHASHNAFGSLTQVAEGREGMWSHARAWDAVGGSMLNNAKEQRTKTEARLQEFISAIGSDTGALERFSMELLLLEAPLGAGPGAGAGSKAKSAASAAPALPRWEVLQTPSSSLQKKGDKKKKPR